MFFPTSLNEKNLKKFQKQFKIFTDHSMSWRKKIKSVENIFILFRVFV